MYYLSRAQSICITRYITSDAVLYCVSPYRLAMTCYARRYLGRNDIGSSSADARDHIRLGLRRFLVVVAYYH